MEISPISAVIFNMMIIVVNIHHLLTLFCRLNIVHKKYTKSYINAHCVKHKCSVKFFNTSSCFVVMTTFVCKVCKKLYVFPSTFSRNILKIFFHSVESNVVDAWSESLFGSYNCNLVSQLLKTVIEES